MRENNAKLETVNKQITVEFEQYRSNVEEEIEKFKEENPDAYSDFMRIKGKNKFVFAAGEYEGSLNDGAQIGKTSTLTKIPEGIPVYDISSGKFIVRQGNIVKEYVSEKIEE